MVKECSALAVEIYSSVFGPGTDLCAVFKLKDIEDAINEAISVPPDERHSSLMEVYGAENSTSVPEMIAIIGMEEESNLKAAAVSQERLDLALGLKKRVSDFLKAMPERYPGLCPESFLSVSKGGLHAVVLEFGNLGEGKTPSKRYSVVPDTQELVETSGETGLLRLIITRGCSLEQAHAKLLLLDPNRAPDMATTAENEPSSPTL